MASGCDHAEHPPEFRNRLLATFSHEALSALRPHLKPMTLARGAVLREAIDSRRSVYFIEYGLASLVTGHPAPAVVATVGREGAVGGPTLLLGGGIAFGRYEMLISGAALALEAPCFHNALRQDPKVHSLCEPIVRHSLHKCFKTCLQRLAHRGAAVRALAADVR
jgi:hypothetical protein